MASQVSILMLFMLDPPTSSLPFQPIRHTSVLPHQQGMQNDPARSAHPIARQRPEARWAGGGPERAK